jgi:hypothetical protein
MDNKQIEQLDPTAIEGNKLIADFIGLKWHENGTISNYLSVLNMRMGMDTVDDLKFHTSFDWLMPVVEKIKMQDEWRWDYPNRSEYYDLQRALSSIDLLSLWQATVNFIKWYNQTQNNG